MRKGRGRQTFDNGPSRHLFRQQAAPMDASCWPRSWTSRAGPVDRMWHGETRGPCVSPRSAEVVRRDGGWPSRRRCPIWVMIVFFQRLQWHLAYIHPASLPGISQMLLCLCNGKGTSSQHELTAAPSACGSQGGEGERVSLGVRLMSSLRTSRPQRLRGGTIPPVSFWVTWKQFWRPLPRLHETWFWETDGKNVLGIKWWPYTFN